MRKNKIIACFLFASLIILFNPITSICYSKGKISPGEKGMAFLMALNDRGLVNWRIDSPFFNVFVEPKLWSSFTHMEKNKFCRHVLNTAKYLLQKGQKVGFFSVFDMTSHEQYAKGSLKDNNIKIIK